MTDVVKSAAKTGTASNTPVSTPNVVLDDRNTPTDTTMQDSLEVAASPRGYNINSIFNSRGTSKRIRLDEIEHQARQRVTGQDETELNPANAFDVATELVGRAVITDDNVRATMVKCLTDGLNANISDPVKWMNDRFRLVSLTDAETYRSDHRIYNEEDYNAVNDGPASER